MILTTELIPITWSFMKADDIAELEFWGKENLRTVIRHWRSKAKIIGRKISGCKGWVPEDWRMEKAHLEQVIRYLLEIKETAEEKPLFPFLRPIDFFKEDEWVICNPSQVKFSLCSEATFYLGCVVGESKNPFPGCYGRGSWEIDVLYRRTIAGQSLKEHIGGDNMPHGYPFVMKLEEKDYLLDHPEFAELWAKAHRHEEDIPFIPETFLAELEMLRN